jgi:hypothetical protein
MNDQDIVYDQNSPALVRSPFLPSSPEKRVRFEEVMAAVLPQLGAHKGKLVAAQVMIALKIEGILDRDLNDKEIRMIQSIKDAVLADPEREKQALSYAKLKQLGKEE